MKSRLGNILLGTAAGLAILYMLAPATVVILASFNPTITLKVPPDGFSLQWYQEFLNSSLFVGAFLNSIKIAVTASLIAAVLGVPSAYAVVRYNFKGRDLIQTALLSPLFVPSIIIGVSLLSFFVMLGIRGTFVAIVFGHALLTFPYVVRTTAASLVGIDPKVEEAATILGANPVTTFFKVTLPLMSSGIFAGVLFSFVISLGELNASLFLSGPTTVTLPIQIFSYLQWNTSPVIAAVSTIQILLILSVSLVIEKVFGLTKVLQFG